MTTTDDAERDRLDQATSGVRFYDRSGRRIRYSEYSHLREDPSYRVLARDRVAGGEVVTAWLGTDQGPGDPGDPPSVFGTVTIDAAGSLVDGQELFSASEAEAFANHAQVVARRRSTG